MNFLEQSYYLAKLIRRSEEEIIRLYPSDKVKSPVHLSIGQESIAVGVGLACDKTDFIFSNYRSHAHYLAHGGDLKRMWAELYGKMGGCSNGKGGSMHLGDINVNFAYTSAIVASQVSNAVGYALAMKMQKKSSRAICYFGDGATEEGAFWESCNFAALKQLPILFICENNQYAIYTHQTKRQANDNILARVEAFGVEGTQCLDNSVHGIYQQTKDLLTKIAQTGKPQYLEIPTSRFRDHVGVGDDRYLKFRSDAELDKAISEDDLPKMRAKLSENIAQNIDSRVESEIADALNFAESQEFPTTTELYSNVYAQ